MHNFEEIKNEPVVVDYPDLLKAANNGHLVIFVGAGVSRLLGCPSWLELAHKYADHLFKSECITFREKQLLTEINNPRKLLTICKHISKMQNKPFKQLSDLFNPENSDLMPIYDDLFSLHAKYVTTNYDLLLERAAENFKMKTQAPQLSSNFTLANSVQVEENNLYYQQKDINIPNLDSGHILHIHGVIDDPDSMILTLDDYMKLYQEEEFIKFLKKMFDQNVVLFIGYGIEDTEILELLFTKVNSPNSNKERYSYMLYPTYKEDRKLCEHLQIYYEYLGVKLIPYNIGEKGYYQLANIIKAWSNVIKCNPKHFYERIEIFEDGTTSEIMAQIKQSQEFENYFFQTESDIRLFQQLNMEGYFSPKKILEDTEICEGRKVWNVLSYLERISVLVKKDTIDVSYAIELLKIIEDITNILSANDNVKNNSYTWRCLLKIIVNLPNDKITQNHINLIQTWLSFDPQAAVFLGSEMVIELLPKFLNDNSTKMDVIIAEKIINMITTIQFTPSTKDQKRAKNKEYKPVVEMYWLEKYFQKNCEIVAQKCSMAVLHDIITKTHLLLSKESKEVIEIGTQPYILVLNTDVDKSSLFLIKVETEGKNTEELFQEIYFESPDYSNALFQWSIEESKQDEFVQQVLFLIADTELFNKVNPAFLKKKINSLHSNLYSEGTHRSFHEKREHHIHDVIDLFTLIFKKVLIFKAKIDVPTTEELLRHFLKERYLYFTKMALYIFSHNTSQLKSLLWELITSDKWDSILSHPYLKDELKHLFENLGSLSSEQKDLLKRKIEEGPKHYIPSGDIEIKLWKQQRYQALSHDPDFKHLCNLLKKETQVDAQLSPAIGPIQTRSGEGPSPLTIEEMTSFTNIELSIFLKNFRTTDFWNGPTVGALADEIKKLATEQPTKLIDDLSPFMDIPFIHIYHMFGGFIDAWKNKKEMNWEKLLNFANQYIRRDLFWSNAFIINDDHWDANFDWVVSIFAELLQEGTRTDDWAFDCKYNRLAQSILFYIFDNLIAEKDTEIRDPLHHALNSSRGKSITALILLALRISRQKYGKESTRKVKWPFQIKNKYNQLLQEHVVEAYTLFSDYLPQLMYLDKPWVRHKIKEFQGNISEKDWSAFMQSYLCQGINSQLYKLMKNHYLKALHFPFPNEIEERLVDHITLGYLHGNESYSAQSLFGMILIERKPNHMKTLIRYLVSQSDYLARHMDFDNLNSNEDHLIIAREEIFLFWKWLYKEYKDIEPSLLNQDDKEILSDATDLMVLLKEINHNSFQWLKISAPYVAINFNSHSFITHLNQIKDKGDSLVAANFIGQLFLEMLTFGFYPDYPKEDICEIVDYLFKLNNLNTIDLAKKICEKYGSRSTDFLKPIYDKYRE